MSPSGRAPSLPETETMLAAARIFAAITAESIAQAGSAVTLPQLRVLVLAAERRLSATDVAHALSVHLSTASRICDKLVQAGFLDRRDRPEDRRQIELSITSPGAALLTAVTEHRRVVFDGILARMNPQDRVALAGALDVFVATAADQRIGTTGLP